MINNSLFTSKSQEWCTPQNLFDDLNREFHFTLDPCSTDKNAKRRLHYTVADDGLQKPWGGGRTCSATHHMAKRYLNGLRNAMRKV